MKDLIVNVSAIISVVLAIYCGIPYMRSVIRGKSKPHQLSWLVFSLMLGVTTASQFLKGGRASILVSLVFFVYDSLIFLLSLKYGTRNTSAYDRLLFIFSLLTIVAWALTRNSTIAIWLTILVDALATAMILLKLRVDPHSEAVMPWTIGTLAYLFSCFALLNKPFGILYARPIYGFLSEGAVPAFTLYLLVRQQRKSSKVLT